MNILNTALPRIPDTFQNKFGFYPNAADWSNINDK